MEGAIVSSIVGIMIGSWMGVMVSPIFGIMIGSWIGATVRSIIGVMIGHVWESWSTQLLDSSLAHG
jgi:hypothetical protein